MAQYVVTPWRSINELLEVRDLIFGGSSDNASDGSSAAAVQRIQIWKERGNLPHAVESTGQLVEALLFNKHESQKIFDDESHGADSFPVRATYTAALTRFVTGFADLGRSRSGPGQSMLEVARDIDLPVKFVELRHEATHEGMPNLTRLHNATSEALIWLQRVYWDKIESGEHINTSTAHRQLSFSATDGVAVEEPADVRTVLKDYRRIRKADLQGGKATDGQVLETAVMRLIALALDMRHGNRIVAEAFCTTSILLPTTQVSSLEQMDPAYRLWDDLLQSLACQSRTFFKPFLRVMIERSSQAAEQPRFQGLVYWTLHIFDSPSWTGILGVRYPTLLRYTIEQCLLNPSRTAQYLVRELMGLAPGRLRDVGVLTAVSRTTLEGYEDDEHASVVSSASIRHSKHQLRNTLVT